MKLFWKKNKTKLVVGKGAPPPAEKKTKVKVDGPGTMKRMGLALANMGLGKFRSPFIQNLAMMLGAGLHVNDALSALEREAKKGPMHKLIGKIRVDVDNGLALWRAMDARGYFTPYSIALVRIGEESGNLAENLSNLAIQDEKDHAMKQKVKMAMIYPTIVIILTFIIAIGLSWFILPQLVGVLFALNVELPATTLAVIAVSDFFTKHGAVFVPSLVSGMALVGILAKFTKLQIVAQWILLRIPGIKTLIREASIARFGIILGSLMAAGVATVESLRSLTEVTTLYSFKRFYQKLA